jgi:hypothetical protein
LSFAAEGLRKLVMPDRLRDVLAARLETALPRFFRATDRAPEKTQ